MKPVIGITCCYLSSDITGRLDGYTLGAQGWDTIAEDYVFAVEAAGGIPVLLPVHQDPENTRALLSRLDGVVVSGGADIGPILYGEHPSERIGRMQYGQDLHEMALLKALLGETALPVLAVCRGMQMLNVVMGGTLYQDHGENGLPEHNIRRVDKEAVTHMAEVHSGSLLEMIVGEGSIGVNSYHHQSVHTPGEGIVVSARTGQVVEAIELPERPAFTLGVQWHPEVLYKAHPGQLALFSWLVDSAKQ